MRNIKQTSISLLPDNSTSRLGIFMILLMFSMAGFGQRNYLFENISIPQGLSNTEVHYMCHDSNGYLWITTADGLNRYDGNNFTVFKNDPGDTTTIGSNYCSAITEDLEGNIWIGTLGNQIAKFNSINETFQNYPIDKGTANEISDTYSAITDSKNNIWFGTTNHGIQKLNKATNRFEKIALDTSNGAKQWGQIYCIKELKNGNIIAADYANGIIIYDQNRNVFQPYYLKTNYSPKNISAIYEDASANIWFGGNNTLIKYTPAYYTTEDYDPFDLFISPTNYDNVTGIVQDKDGYIWIGIYSQGLYRIDPSSKQIDRFTFGFDSTDKGLQININSMITDRYGVVWIGISDNGLIKFDPLREPFTYTKIKSDETSSAGIGLVTNIAGLQNHSSITIGTSDKGLYTYDFATKQTKKLKVNYATSATSDKLVDIQSLAIDENGNTWFAYNNLGLHKLDRNNVLSQIDSPIRLKYSGLNINQIKFDLSGNVWLADRAGFEKYDPVTNESSLLPTIMSKRMSNKLRSKILAAAHSQQPICSILQVGEASNLEKQFDLDTDQKVMILSVGEGRLVQGIDGLFDKGALLDGEGQLIWAMNNLAETYNDGGGFKNRIAIKCLELKKGRYKLTFSTDVGHSYANWNVQAPPDSLWYGIQLLKLTDAEYKAISELNGQEINSDQYMPLELGNCLDMSKKFNKILWLGSQRNGFFKYDLVSGKYKQYNLDQKSKFSPNNTVTSIYEDRDGLVWVATQNSLIKFDPSNENIEKFNQKDGLPSSLINSITEDLQGNLWINTSNGLSKLNKTAERDKWNFVNFDTKDGLPGFSSSKASWISKDGEIVLGHNEGIVSFFPGKINEIEPNIVLEDIKISDVSLKTSDKLSKNINQLEELVLSYKQNNLSFEFASIHFSRPEKNKILYTLEGFDTHWISSTRDFVSYTNLTPGKYTFKIKGSNGDGIWKNEAKTLHITISPPWWQTKLAYGFYVVLFALLVYGADRYFRQRAIKIERQRNQARELEQAREIEKAYTELKATQSQLIQSEKMASLGELTAGIAHEIQNPLNFVNNFSEVNAELIDEALEANEKGNASEVTTILNDLKENENKITHHGKRAESIVKGMLQHSRSSSGQKEPTDINALADEYLRLSYHGLRAKDKSFIADFKLESDAHLPIVNVVPQDFGRVLLNLINNAFYAVNEKAKNNPPQAIKGGITESQFHYKPMVKVTTKVSPLQGGLKGVSITVEDNGNGIPDSVKDKIFQPFFTTKPAGSGTGLGLSLSYDIVKAHGGELEVESNENEGTNFTIVIPNNHTHETI